MNTSRLESLSHNNASLWFFPKGRIPGKDDWPGDLGGFVRPRKDSIHPTALVGARSFLGRMPDFRATGPVAPTTGFPLPRE